MSTGKRKEPPLLSKAKIYHDWKKKLEIWSASSYSGVAKAEQGTALLMTLEGKAEEAALQIPSDVIMSEKGLASIIEKLDALYMKDTIEDKFDVLLKFETFKRKSGQSIQDYILEFEGLYSKAKSYGTQISEDLLAFRLMRSANLSSQDEKIVKGALTAAELNLANMKMRLKKILTDTEGSSESTQMSINEINEMTHEDPNFIDEQSNSTFYIGQRRGVQGRFGPRPAFRQPSPYISSPSRPQQWRGNSGGARGRGRNPVSRTGNVSQCSICSSTYHWQAQCPERLRGSNTAFERRPIGSGGQRVQTQPFHNSTFLGVEDQYPQSSATSAAYCPEQYFEGEYPGEGQLNDQFDIVLFQSDYDHPDNLRSLVSESWNAAVLDSGATKTVCGRAWFEQYRENLPADALEKVIMAPVKNGYKFGDQNTAIALVNAAIPAKLGSQDVILSTDIVERDIPLLLSRESMKKASMSIDFSNDTAQIFGQCVPLNVTRSGHYTVPLTSATQLLSTLDGNPGVNVTLSVTNTSSVRQQAVKIHKQFAHAPTTKLCKLLNSAGPQWASNEDLKKELQKVESSCNTCIQYRQAKPRPSVGLPLASKFLDTVAMDLKFHRQNILIHLVDHATRLSQAARIPNKKPSTILKAIFSHWIGIFGTPVQFLSDNGGEFINNEFVELCESANIVVKTTGAESPWSNGLVERHNLIISEMLDRVLEDCNVPYDVALAWCINAKNSLENCHGFSPYQLAMGKNPTLPGFLHDELPALTSEPSSEVVRQNLNALHAARVAFTESENSERLRRALASNTRTYSDTVVLNGDTVYYKRKGCNKWKGPAKVLGKDGAQILLKHGGYYIRVHHCRVRLSNDDRISRNVDHSSSADVKDPPVYSSSDSDSEPATSGTVTPDFHAALHEVSLPPTQSYDLRNRSGVDLPARSVIPDAASVDQIDCRAEASLECSDSSRLTSGIGSSGSGSSSLTSGNGRAAGDSSCLTSGIGSSGSGSLCLTSGNSSAAGDSSHLTSGIGSSGSGSSCLTSGRSPDILRKNDAVNFTLREGNKHLEGKLVSRSGKATGKWRHSWNVNCTDGSTRSVDFSRDVDSWDFASTASSGDTEILEHSTMYASVDEDIEAAKQSELKSWMDREVYDEVNDEGQKTISVRWVVTPKVIDGKPSTKARLVAKGYQEEQPFRTDSPTCNKENIRLCLAIAAMSQWQLNSTDIQSAFLQGSRLDRTVYLRPPPEAKTNKVWRLRKCVYGLADAPRSFYLKLRDELLKLGVKQSSADHGLYFYHRNGRLQGIIVCHVDDMLWAGTELFKSGIICALQDSLSFGSQENTAFRYLGIDLRQHEDFSIELSQSSFAKSIQSIECPAGLSKDQPAPDDLKAALRAVIGKLNWISLISRPEISFEVSTLASKQQTASVHDISQANRLICRVQNEPASIYFPCLNPSTLHVQLYTDASFNSLPNNGSQGGRLVFLCDQEGRSAPLAWGSTKVKRVVRSALGAETLALCDGCELAYVIANTVQSILPPLLLNVYAIIDSQSLYEHLGSTKSAENKRLRLEISALREMIVDGDIRVKLVPGSEQLANALTKKGASWDLIRQAMLSGCLPSHS